jgi:hypothetical protein
VILAVLSTIASVVGIVGFAIAEIRHIRRNEAPRWSILIWATVAVVAVGLAAWAWERDRQRSAVASHAERVLDRWSWSDYGPPEEEVIGSGISFFAEHDDRYPKLAEQIRALQRYVDAELPPPDDEFDTWAENERERRVSLAAGRIRGMLQAVADGDEDAQ